MGYATSIHCKCQEKPLWLDVGMGYHAVYQETMKNIKDGKYGPEMKDLVLNKKYVVVDATFQPYYCEKCGYVESTMPLDLYEPRDMKEVETRIINRWCAADPSINKTVGELGEFPYWYPNSDKKGFKILKKYVHICPECGELMKKTNIDKLFGTKCPKCGEKYSRVPGILDIHWD